MNFKELLYKITNIFTLFVLTLMCVMFAYKKYIDYKEKQIIQEKRQQMYNQINQSVIDEFIEESHINKLVDIIWCEDRTSIENAKDVLSTIINRSKNKTSIEDLVAVVNKAYQFSCNNDPIIIASQRIAKADIIMKNHIKAMVIQAINGEFIPTHHATHYYAYRKIKTPKWAKKMKIVKVNNNHVFLI